MSHVVVLDRVTKRYRDQVALDNVTLRVPAGVVFALLGENGAGKEDHRDSADARAYRGRFWQSAGAGTG